MASFMTGFLIGGMAGVVVWSLIVSKWTTLLVKIADTATKVCDKMADPVTYEETELQSLCRDYQEQMK
jgi:hypothetical protein